MHLKACAMTNIAALSSCKTHDVGFVLLRIRKSFVNVIQSVSRKEVFVVQSWFCQSITFG